MRLIAVRTDLKISREKIVKYSLFTSRKLIKKLLNSRKETDKQKKIRCTHATIQFEEVSLKSMA